MTLQELQTLYRPLNHHDGKTISLGPSLSKKTVANTNPEQEVLIIDAQRFVDQELKYHGLDEHKCKTILEYILSTNGIEFEPSQESSGKYIIKGNQSDVTFHSPMIDEDTSNQALTKKESPCMTQGQMFGYAVAIAAITALHFHAPTISDIHTIFQPNLDQKPPNTEILEAE